MKMPPLALPEQKITETLDEALQDCNLVFGTSARMRKLPQEMLTPREAAKIAISENTDSEIAFVFGNEKFGLNNEGLYISDFYF